MPILSIQSSIKPGEISEHVKNLQEALDFLGFSIEADEMQRRTYGESTQRAVQQFQRRMQLSETDGAVATVTASRLNQILKERGAFREEAQFLVHGVVTKNNQPVTGLIVRAFDQDLPSKKNPRELLGEVRTDNKGEYLIVYQPEKAAAAELYNADLVIQVLDTNARLLAETPVYYNAERQKTVNVELIMTESIPEFDEYLATIKKPLDEVNILNLTDKDIEFLSKETDIEEAHIEFLVISHKLSGETRSQIPPDIFYALFRDGYPLEISLWYNKKIEEIRTVLLQSVNEIIAERNKPWIDRSLQILMDFIIGKAQEQPVSEKEPSLQELIGTALESKEKQNRFLQLYSNHKQNSEEFWKELSDNPEFKNDVPRIQFSFQLAAMSVNNVKLMNALQGNANSVRQLADWDDDKWIEFMDKHSITVPDSVSGSTASEKKKNYIGQITSLIEGAYPTPFVRRQVIKHPLIDYSILQKLKAINQDTTDLLDLSADELVLEGLSEDEQKKAREAFIVLQEEINAYPAFAEQVRSSNVLSNGTSIPKNKLRDDLDLFFRNAADFDLSQHTLHNYLKEKGSGIFNGIEDREGVTLQLHTMQRLYNVSADAKKMQLLMNSGFSSAHDIAQMPFTTFLEKSAGKFDDETAMRMYSRSGHIASTLQMSYQSMFELGLMAMPEMLAPNKPDIDKALKAIPDYETLFGSLSMCDCEDCKSVYSPAAYFVELLHVVLNGKYNGAASKELFKRRPDLKFTKLTCENTFTPMPYIDLVLEILETYTAFGILSAAYTRDSSPYTADELAANPQYVIRTAYTILEGMVYPLALPFDIDLATIRVYLEHQGSSRYSIMKHFRNDGQQQTLQGTAAEHLYISNKEYEILTGTKLNGSASAIINHTRELFGFTIADLRPTLSIGMVVRPVYVLQRLLNKHGASPILVVDGNFGPMTRNAVKEFQASKGMPQTGIANLTVWNQLTPEEKLLGEHLAIADTLIETLEISYDDLIALVQTRFLNRHHSTAAFLQNPEISTAEKNEYLSTTIDMSSLLKKVLVLAAPDDKPCDLNRTLLLRLDGEVLSNEEAAKLNRFVRLWKKLGCTIPEADLLLITFDDTEITGDAIKGMSKAAELQKRFQIPYEKLVCLWRNINTRGKNSLYQQLFLNRTALKLDDKLVLNGPLLGLQHKNEKINNHIPVLLAAFRISEEDLVLIREDADLDKPGDELSLGVLSKLYRYVVLAKATKLKIPQLISLKKLSGIDAFADPYQTELFAQLADDIRNAGFKIPVLDYLYRHIIDATVSGLPAADAIANLARTIREGLLKIDTDTTLPASEEDANIPVFTAELLQTKLSMLFEEAIVSKTVVMLDLDETGTFTDAERQSWLNEVYYAFLQPADITNILVEGSREQRVRMFLESSLPYLREQLSNMFVRQTMASALKADTTIITLLLETIIKSKYTAGATVNADILALRSKGVDGDYFDNKDLVSSPNSFRRTDTTINFDWQAGSPDAAKIPVDLFSVRWTGKLICPSTNEFTFYANTDDGVRVWVNDQLIIDQWNNQPLTEHTGKILLKAGTIYNIRMEYFENIGNASAALYWSNPVMAKSIISPDYLMPESLIQQFSNMYLLLHKAVSVINTLGLTADEIDYFSKNAADFANFDLNQIPITPPAAYDPNSFSWLTRLIGYKALKKNVQSTEVSWLSVFAQAGNPFASVFETILTVTGWNETDLRFLLGTDYGNGYFNAPAADFKNEKLFLKLAVALETARQLGVSAEKASGWKNISATETMSTDIKNTVRAKYEDEDWLEIAKELNDKLRVQQRDALVAFLKKREKIETTDKLYEYFLIDFEMDACMITSRLKQAIASVQLFVQRCLLNIEKKVPTGKIDAQQWKWMKNYRVWEANRKVFLYPENWIEPELRDNKSPFFKELESELLQSDITAENVETAIMHYLQKLDEVARLDICGMYVDKETKEVHIVGKTHTGPYTFYYRKRTADLVWTPWEKLPLDIQVMDDGDEAGVHVVPVIWNRRLHILWPTFTWKDEKPTQEQKDQGTEAFSYWEIRMNWTEFRQGKWTPKKTTSKYIKSPTLIISLGPIPFGAPTGYNHPSHYHSFISSKSSDGSLIIQAFRGFSGLHRVERLGYFVFTGCNDRVFRNTDFDPDYNKKAYTVSHTEQFFQSVKAHNNDKPLKLLDATKDTLEVLGATIGRFELIRSNDEFTPKKDIPYHYYSFCLQDKKRNFFAELVRVPVYSRIVNMIKNPSSITINLPNSPGGTSPRFNVANAPVERKAVTNRFRQPAYGSSIVLNDAVEDTVGTATATDNMIVIEKNTSIGFGVQSNWQLGQYGFAEAIPGRTMIPTVPKIQFYPFDHAFVNMYMRALNMNGVPGLLTIGNQMPEDNAESFTSNYYPKNIVSKEYPHKNVDFSVKGAYSLYNWELFFHIPMMIANTLSKNQKFEEAQDWYHYIFDPTTNLTTPVPGRFWNVLPFKSVKKENIEDLLKKLQLSPSSQARKDLEAAIVQWRKNPFNPHLVARLRLIAYEKNVVMKYIDNLIAWADRLFSQDTIESINEATQIYMLAGAILGERPPHIPVRGKTDAQNYSTLRPKLDAFSNALVKMETIFPFYSTDDIPVDLDNPAQQLGSSVSVPYFCVPDNDKLLGYWDIIADRLFKIRHCQNIEGVERSLALFEPPIDPAMLVQAAAKGIDISSVLNDLNTPKPYYRFPFLVQKALELCNELKSLGAALLNAIEKKDAEAIVMIRATQETSLLNLVKEVKKLQIKEALRNREGLEKTKETVEAKAEFYKGLVEEGLNSGEEENIVQSTIGFVATLTSQFLEMAAACAHPVPEVGVGGAGSMGSPLNINTVAGGSKVGSALSASGRFAGMIATMANFAASRALMMANYSRREKDWDQQKDQANKEIKQIEKQILAAQIREEICYKEVENQDKQIEQAKAVEEFLRNKFTNEELYIWMQGEIATIYFQTYQVAYDLAKKAEKAFRFERGLTSSNFIQFGNWDSMRKGLMAGERLALSLHQMEKAYLDQHAREYEINKMVSLLNVNPLALVQLKETGSCEVELPELIFDMDYPGHYMRRIKSVSLSIPCIVGPYSNVNCTLTLLSNKIRIKNIVAGQYQEKVDEDDNRFLVNFAAMQSIATSSGQNDSGMFEMNFRDERYLPFEGSGAISKWRIEMPQQNNAFDLASVSDVVIRISYTARDGGKQMKTAAEAYRQALLSDIDNSPLFRMYHMRHEFPNEWFRFTGGTEAERNLVFGIDKYKFPFILNGKKITITGMEVFVKNGKVIPSVVVKAPSGDTKTINLAKMNNTLDLYKGSSSFDEEVTAENIWTITELAADIEGKQEFFVVVSYTIS